MDIVKKAAEIWHRVGEGNAIIACAVTCCALLLGGTPAGEMLSDRTNYRGAAALRSWLGVHRLAPELRFIVNDDRTIKLLGRPAQFADWLTTADKLQALGFERILLLDVPFGDQGNLAGVLKPKLPLFLGAVASTGYKSRRRSDAEAIPSEWLVPATRRGYEEDGAETSYVLPAPETHPFTEGIGHLNLDGIYRMASGFYTEGGGVVPNLGLRAKGQLEWRDGRPLADGRTIPTNADGSLYIEYLDAGQIYPAAVSLSSFFDADKAPRSNLSVKARENLNGGKIALLIPQGHTGSRFVDSPRGKVPSYLVPASVANSFLNDSFLHRPVRPFWIIGTFALLILTCMMKAPYHLAVKGSLAWLVLAGGVAAVAAARWGWILPLAECYVVLAVAMVARGGVLAVRIRIQRAQLDQQLDLGRVVQESFLPEARAGQIGDWQYQVFYEAHGAMSGDWYQIHADASSGTAVLAVGDVVGKGPSAALVTSVIASVWRQYRAAWQTGTPNLSELCLDLAAQIHETFRNRQNTTLSAVLLTPEEATIASAAAPLWIRYDPEAKTAERCRTGPHNPLGYLSEGQESAAPVKPMVLTLRPGEVLLACTDGALDGIKSYRLLMDDLERIPPPEDSDALFQFLAEQVRRAGKGHVLDDDVTMLMIRRAPRAKAAAA